MSAQELYNACKNGDKSAVQSLLRKSSATELNTAIGDQAWTPFFVACFTGHLEVVKLLLADPRVDCNKANVNEATPFFMACFTGHLEVVKLLLADPRVDCNKANVNRTTPFFMACQEGHLEVVKLLLADPRVDCNKAKNEGFTPFYIACQEGHLEVVKLLQADRRVDCNKATNDGITPLAIASQNKHQEVVKLLQDHASAVVNKISTSSSSSAPTPTPSSKTSASVSAFAPEIPSRNLSSSSSSFRNLAPWEVAREEFEFVKDPRGQRKKLGEGGFGAVFLGMWRGRECAIKQIHMHGNTSESSFMAEVKLLYLLQHENIGKVIGGCQSIEEESYFMLMEKIGGGSIKSKIQSGPLSVDQITKYCLGIAKALAHIHEQNPVILHRDIKPDNILVDERDSIKLIDFGIAKVEGAESTTVVGGAKGTPRWMSPELYDDPKVVSPACDVWAFGLVVWQMFSRKLPFENIKEPFQIIMFLMKPEPIKLEWPRDTPEFFISLVGCCLQKNHTLRPSMDDIVFELETFKRRKTWTPSGFIHQFSQLQVSSSSSSVPTPAPASPVSGHYASAPAPVYQQAQPNLPPVPGAGPVIKWATVNYQFIARAPNELSIYPGTTISVLNWVPGGWSHGEFNGFRGDFPSDYVKLM